VKQKLWNAAILTAALAVVAGCGSSSTSTSGGSGGASVKGVGANAKVINPSQAKNAKGTVTWCIGKDTTGAFSEVIQAFNKSHPGLTVKLVELPTSADQQRTQLVQRQQAKSSECDVLGMDVVWTAEFAAQNWLYDVSPAIKARQGEFIPATLATAKINGKYWAVPFNTNAGFLYYDPKVKQAPKTWQQAYQMAKTDGGLTYQGAQYEGLTVNFLELLYSAGGTAVSSDGKKATIDSPQAQKVLAFMAQGLKDGAVPKSTLTFMEEESRTAFQNGKVAMLRNWPYVYSLAKAAHVKFNLEALPKWQGGTAASVLGGYNLGISTYSKNPGGALEFVNYATGPAAQKKFFIKSSLPAVLTQTYTDPTVKSKVPFAATLLKAVQQGKPRPISPVYPQINEAINKNVYSALQGSTSPQTALKNAQSQINKALATF
jgi:multiple sugar transport system substrate-binding protein